jgi:hypothetical protein
MADNAQPAAPHPPAPRPPSTAWYNIHIRTRDDAGTPCRVDLEDLSRHSRSLPSPGGPLIFASVNHPLWARRSFGLLGVTAVASFFGLTVVQATHAGPHWLQMIIVLAFAVSFLGCVVIGSVEWAFRVHRAKRRCIPACQARICPCCRYSLAGVRPSDDALTRCPECGLAWRVS